MSTEDSNSKAGKAAAVVIGASVGAIEALTAILPALPESFPLPVLVVVHIPPDRKTVLPELFASRCSLPVKEAEDKEAIAAAPSTSHPRITTCWSSRTSCFPSPMMSPCSTHAPPSTCSSKAPRMPMAMT